MAKEKVWTSEQKLLASARVYDAVREAMGDNPDRASQDRIIAAHNQVSILRECELTAAVELLQMAEYSGKGMLDKRLDWSKKRGLFLKRNTGGSDGK